MTRLAIFTASFRNDLENFRDLHDSVSRFTDADVVHHVVVPSQDLGLFEPFMSSRTRISTTRDYLPARFVSTYAGVNALRRIPRMGPYVPRIEAVNVRRPWPPVRGWILQQVVKLAALAHIDADVVVLVDSDVAFVRPLTVDAFWRDGTVRHYRSGNALTPDLDRHATWHRVSRRLLGLSACEGDLSADYVTSFVAWDPSIVRRIHDQIEQATGRPWMDAVASELHFSEFMLYGCYLENFGTARDRAFIESDSLCQSCWGTVPLDRRTGAEFVEAMDGTRLAVHVQSRTNTPLDVRRGIIAAAQSKATSRGGGPVT